MYSETSIHTLACAMISVSLQSGKSVVQMEEALAGFKELQCRFPTLQ